MKTMKQCGKCGRLKPRSEYHKNNTRGDGLQARCKPCQIAAVAANHRKNPAKAVERVRRWRLANPAKHRKNVKRAIEKAKPRKRQKALQRYQITAEQYSDMLSLFAGNCHICRTRQAAGVDHCHVTGQVRGVLCANCNFGIGHFRDDPELIEAAAAYLRVKRTPPAVVAI